MKSPTVADLKAGKANGGLFLVQSKDVREGKTGKKYMSLSLMDSTGEIDARMWDNVETASVVFDRDDFIRVEGETQEYQGKQQLIVHKLRRAGDEEVELKDFLPASKRDPAEMFAELQAIIAGMGNPHLKALLDAMFADPRIAESFRTAPAAKSIHHAWLGGLLEHVLSMSQLARLAGQHYVSAGYGIDLDLLLTGVILHDIGKIDELSYARSFSYSTPGQLLGHIVMGVQMIEDKLRGLPDFPPKLRMLVLHMILGHHGQIEFGSPKLPVFLEALLLAQIDNLDSKMATMLSSLERDREPGAEWAGYNPALERQVLDKTTFLSERPIPAPVAPVPSSSARPSGKLAQRPKQSTAIGSALLAALGDQPGAR